MTSVVIRERWLSRNLTGPNKHALIVRVRPGYMTRNYMDSRRIDDGSTPFDGSPIFPPLIWKGHNHSCWQGIWVPTDDWRTVPNISHAKWSRDFDVQTGGQKGASNCEVVMDNIAFPAETGVAGLYHIIAGGRGFFSPSRGITAPSRPNVWHDAANTWKNVLNGGYQLEIWEGYGQGADIELLTELDPDTNSYAPPSGALKRTWTGIVVDCDQESHPDKITLTARDFGMLLTDQRIMGRNKAPEVPSPVTFADRKRIQGQTKISGPLTVSDGGIADGVWTSHGTTDPTDTKWIELTLPQGYYTDFFVAPEFDGMGMFVSIHLNGTGTMDHTVALPTGWLTLAGTGTGTTPDGTPYIRRVGTLDQSPARRWGFGHGFDLPDGSKLRLTFTNLSLFGADSITVIPGPPTYYAGTNEFASYRYGSDPASPPPGTPPTAHANGYILVEDAAEVIRMVLIWAGFKEWTVEQFGWTLFFPRTYGADKSFIDVIQDMLTQGAFIFYMDGPTNDDRSIGVPRFQHMTALDPPPRDMLTVRDVDMTESLEDKWNLEDLPHVLCYRGAINKAGSKFLGAGISGLVRRFQAIYYPPWAGISEYVTLAKGTVASEVQIRRDAGVLRYFTETMGSSILTQLTSNAECLFACVLAAFQYALNMHVGTFQIPGVPVNLNEQVSVFDRASATNSRMWIVSIQSEHEMGTDQAPGHWRMTLGGSLIDSPEMDSLRADYQEAWKGAQAKRVAL